MGKGRFEAFSDGVLAIIIFADVGAVVVDPAGADRACAGPRRRVEACLGQRLEGQGVARSLCWRGNIRRLNRRS